MKKLWWLRSLKTGFVFAILIIFAPLYSYSSGKLDKEKGVTTITSEKMSAFSKENRANFQKNVHVVSPDLEINCDTLEVFYEPEGKGEGALKIGTSKGKIKKLIATGNVHIKQRDGKSISDKAEYNAEKRTLLLIGKPEIQRLSDTVKGKLITIYLDENRMEVEEGTVTVHTEGEETIN